MSTAGKPGKTMTPASLTIGPGVSLIVGSTNITTNTATRYDAPPTRVAFQAPSLGASWRPKYTAATISSAESPTNSRYSSERWKIVESSLVAGGFGGYLRAGTIHSEMNMAPATSTDSTRAETLPTLPCATAKTTANNAPMATLNRSTPKPMPTVDWMPRLNSSPPSPWL